MEIVLRSVSLLIYIWGLVEHDHILKKFAIESVAILAGCWKDVKKIVGRVECDLKNWLPIFFDDLRNEKNCNSSFKNITLNIDIF